MKILISILLFIVVYSTSFSQTTKVLFIGNSLTGWHAQPSMVRVIAEEAGFDVTTVNSLWYGSDIAEHLSRIITLNNIASEDWDYIVLQGSNYEIAYPIQHYILYPTYEAFEALIHEHYANTKIVFFMDWVIPSGIHIRGVTYTCNDFQELIKSGTMLFADNMNFIVSPIGEAFNYVMNDNPDINLIERDSVHPSLHGAYLASCVYFYIIFGKDFDGQITYHNILPIDEANYLQDVAKDIVMSNYDYWYSTYTDDTGTNINNFQEKNNLFEIFPNPTNNNLNIRTKTNNSKFRIFNLIGEELLSGKISEKENLIHFNFKGGIYLITVEEEGKIMTKKFIVK
jgi:Secretion system C-terminal sorting domain/Domain of unknown function (DUF4886)